MGRGRGVGFIDTTLLGIRDWMAMCFTGVEAERYTHDGVVIAEPHPLLSLY